jgi:hypothetical protein
LNGNVDFFQVQQLQQRIRSGGRNTEGHQGKSQEQPFALQLNATLKTNLLKNWYVLMGMTGREIEG